MMNLQIDEHAELQCPWCEKSLRAVKISQSGPLPLDMVQFLLNRHKESHPSLIVVGGEWFLSERCTARHDGDPVPRQTNPSDAAAPGTRADLDSEGTPNTDREVLAGFFEATDGATWRDNENWATSRSLGDWKGVRVDSASGRVTRLILPNNHIRGRIPTEFGRLAELTNLNLKGNRLGWDIPAELALLLKLRRLNLRGNMLQGEIPPELGRLGSLTMLSLDLNKLTGKIPTELGQLQNLIELRLNHNQLDGQIPTELGELEWLKLLLLDNNRLEGGIPPDLARLHFPQPTSPQFTTGWEERYHANWAPWRS